MRSVVACASALLSIVYRVLAAPSVAFPINSQIPPVARVAQPFQYQFAPNTFTASALTTFQYSLDGAPAWLSVSSNNRTLAGVPQSQDLGQFTFSLSASDGAGTVSSQVTLVVADSPAPSLAANITDALSRSGPLADLTSLSLHPGSRFSIAFEQDTFRSAAKITYDATLADRTPLPSWITFNPESLTFTGTTPPPTPNPQSIPLRLIASTIPGFEDISITFSLVISDHTLAFAAVNQTLTVQPNEPVPDLSLQLLSDGNPIATDEIASAYVNGPSWLSINRQSLTLSGVVPSQIASTFARIRVSDVYGNNANAYIGLNSPDSPPLGMSSTTSSTPTSTDSSTTNTASSSGQPRAKSSPGWIAAAVIAPLAVAILFVIALWWCCTRRQERKRAMGDSDREKQLGEHDAQPSTSLPLGRVSEDSLGSHNQLVLDSQRDFSASGEAPYYRSQHYHKLSPRRAILASQMKDRVRRASRLSTHNGSVSEMRRLTGLGHGRFRSTGSPTRFDALMRVKARRKCTACGCSDVETLESSVDSTRALYQQPTAEMERPSIRLIPREGSQTKNADSQEMLRDLLREVGKMDSRSFQDKRSSYLRRARSVRSADQSTRSHDEHMYDLHKSYDRLKRELGGTSLRKRTMSRPLVRPSSNRSHPAYSFSAESHQTDAGALTFVDVPSARPSLRAGGVRPTSMVPSLESEPIADSLGSNEWTDTEDGSSASPTRRIARSLRGKSDLEEWEEEEKSAQDVKMSRIRKDSHGVPYIISRQSPVGKQLEIEQAQTGAGEDAETDGGAFI